MCKLMISDEKTEESVAMYLTNINMAFDDFLKHGESDNTSDGFDKEHVEVWSSAPAETSSVSTYCH